MTKLKNEILEKELKTVMKEIKELRKENEDLIKENKNSQEKIFDLENENGIDDNNYRLLLFIIGLLIVGIIMK
ncbi:hypothetical protein [Psychrilyobacter atlanticus]|uniref:hypothetical protein n=1 Tax=Psychrilyobacter atlanticus TaxID=271091 RepID=UPI000424340F|nr:hypothetical protein [Psychrilyobacter atlanticus]